jgi:hypothetical protein
MGRKAITSLFARDPLGWAGFYARCGIPMRIIVGAFVAFLLGGALLSQQAEARCWWNGYNHCGYYNHGWWHHGWYHHGYWYR